MAEVDFENNFKNLKDSGVLPDDIKVNSLPPNVRKVIEDLTSDEIKVLQKIAKGSDSYLSLHNKNGFPFSVCGL